VGAGPGSFTSVDVDVRAQLGPTVVVGLLQQLAARVWHRRAPLHAQTSRHLGIKRPETGLNGSW